VETIADKVSQYGKSLITNFYILVKITKIYESMNETILNVAKRLLNEIEILLSDTGEITIKIIEGSFYIEGIRVKAGVSDVESFACLAEEIKKKSIGVFDFRAPVQVEDLINLAYAITGGSEALEIQSKLESSLTKSITIGGPVVLQKGEEVDLKDSLAIAKRVYLRAVASMKEVADTIKAVRRVKIKRIKRALQLLVDCILTDEVYLIGFAITRNYENAYYYHPVNVSILSVALGRRIGFNRVQLRTLAIAAFFHDIGKVQIPLSILNKKIDFTPEEHELFKKHPVDGIKVLLKSLGLNETSILSMLVSFEHHMKLDFSGYPTTSDKRNPNIFSRIVSIADDYDSFISGMVYKRKKLGMENALMLIFQGSGTLYDPLLMKAFMGIFT
jgi:HD-GYP domain-containing protein (c-di-GMP phosphodiesterase class II)